VIVALRCVQEQDRDWVYQAAENDREVKEDHKGTLRANLFL